MRGQEFGTPFVETDSGTAQAVATHAASSGKKFFITDISGSTDKGGCEIVVSNGGTIIWQDRMSNTGTQFAVYSRTFSTPLSGTVGNSVVVTVGSATTMCYANMAGYEL